MNILARVVFRLFIIIALCALSTYLFVKENYFLFSFIFIMLFGFVVNLIYFVNKVNDKISFFFNAIENNDSSLSFNEHVKNRSYRELNKALNRVNKMIQQMRKQEQTHEHYYKTMLNRTATGLISYDEKGVIHHINRTAERMLSIYAPHHIAKLKKIDPIIYETLKGLKPGATKTISLNINNEIKNYYLKAAKFISMNDKLTIVSIEDIQYELDRNELESWNRLIRVISHEIMNSIAPITSLTSTLLNLYEDKSGSISSDPCLSELYNDTQYALSTIHEQTVGLEKFVKTYRQLTNLPKPDLKTIELTPWLKRITLLLHQHPDAEGVEIVNDFISHKVEIIGDENMLSQVMINLGINALQALKNIDRPAMLTIRTWQNDTGRPIISFIDNGCGMNDELKEKAFVPFFTTKEGGSGIGLSLSRQIILIHKGSINIDSKTGEGTKIHIKF